MLWKKHIAVLMILGLVVQAGGYVEWLHVHVEHTDHCDDADTETCPDSEEDSKHNEEACTFCLQLHLAQYKMVVDEPDSSYFYLAIVDETSYIETGGINQTTQQPFGARGPPVSLSHLYY